MSRFIVEGGNKLSGVFHPTGNKNEALPAIAAALLTEEEVILDNIPGIKDVNHMLDIAESLGAYVTRMGKSKVKIKSEKINTDKPDSDLSKKIRASFLFASPLLHRVGSARLYKPGGDKIGRRRLGTHIVALTGLGAEFYTDDYYEFKSSKLIGNNDLFLDEASVMGTENAIMGAVLAEGKTTILNAASEPHVQGLCHMLNKMGAKISGIGSNILYIDGVKKLHGCEHSISPDHMEIGSLIITSAIAGDGVTIKNVIPSNFRMICLNYNKLGINVEKQGEDFFIPGEQDLKIVSEVDGSMTKIDDAPWPGFPTDLMSITIVGATQSQGSILIFEKMFEGRMFFVDHLIQMGANIVLCDLHRVVVTGKTPLRGYKVVSPDIRAGMSLLVASLVADGKTEIGNIEQIDRGYEKIDERLNELGAKIKRVNDL
jgi:UDP-N-acetylglucosamine 1-carboxyvinyltransferase